MNFLNKVAIVTGAGSGIGAAIAIGLSREGAKVTIIARNENNLKAVSDQCEQVGSKPLIFAGDLTKDDTVKNCVSETVKHFGKLDILVNNAGVGNFTKFTEDNALEKFDRVMAINLRAVVNLSHVAVPHLIQSKGNIVNISSVSALRPFIVTGFAYNASKAALDHFSRTIALELGAKGVRVNIVNPGPVRTNIAKDVTGSEQGEKEFWKIVQKGTVFNRISEPEEVADLVLFLASDKAKSVTGASFVIDNGCIINC